MICVYMVHALVQTGWSEWIGVCAENARDAVNKIKKMFPEWEILGVYKEQPEWKWR